jgi:dTDP-4-amino-4,6-dideoxygalactose transaminase
MGDLGCFSFYPTKNLGAFGDAGMVVTHDDHLARRIRILRVHGSDPKYFHRWIGINSRLDSLQAAILLAKFGHLENWTTERQRKALAYSERFQGLAASIPGFQIPRIQFHNRHIFHQYVIRTPGRDELRQYLKGEGIGTDVYYPLPLHLQECYAFLNYRRGELPVSEKAAEETLALPIYPELTGVQQQYVCDRVEAFYEAFKRAREGSAGPGKGEHGL